MKVQIRRTGIGSNAKPTIGRVFGAALLAIFGGALAGNAMAAGELEEIIVYATKKAESVQDIPIAVTAFSGAELQEAAIKDVFDLVQQAPGLTGDSSQNSSTASFSIRGIGTSANNFGLESSVGMYVDGVYRSRQAAIINNLVDIEAVEVLRGPQGTLFGKNTPSGAISIRTVAPSTDGANGFVSITAGDYGLLNASAASNFKLSDQMAVRATVFTGERDGYISDVNKGSNLINDRNRQGGRLQFLFDNDEDLSIRVIADYAEIDEICCGAPTFKNNVWPSDLPGIPGVDYGPGSDYIVGLLGGTIIPGDEYNDYKVALNDLPISTNEDKGISAEVNYDINDDTVFTSITAARNFESFDRIDADFSDADLFTKQNLGQIDSFSQEFRFTGKIGEKTQYVAGAYYYQQDFESRSALITHSQFDSFFFAGLPTLDPVNGPGLQELVTAGNSIYGACLLGLLPCAQLGLVPGPVVMMPDGGTANEVMLQDHSSWAAFSQFDFDISDSLTLTVGLRYTDEEKKLNGTYFQSAGALPDFQSAGESFFALDAASNGVCLSLGTICPDIATNPLAPLQDPGFQFYWNPTAVNDLMTPGWGQYLLDVTAPHAPTNDTLTDSRLSGAVKLSWNVSDDIMLYGSYGNGYKAGGTNTDRINSAFDNVFQSETADTYEIGMKSYFPEQNVRINIAAYSSKIDNLQANSFTGLGFNLQNAGTARSNGGEFEMLWVPTDYFRMQFAWTHTLAKFDDFQKGTCWVGYTWHTGVADPGDNGDGSCNRSGDHMGGPQDEIFISMTRDFRLGSTASAYIRGDYLIRTKAMTDANNDPYKWQEGNSIANLHFGINLESWDTQIALWGRNIFDERYHYTSFDVPIQDGRMNAYPAEPRTIGITVSKAF